MNFTDQFIKDYEDKVKGFPTDNDYPGECLSIVKIYIQKRFGIYPPASGCNGARCYWSVFPNPLGTILKKIPHAQGVVPKKGWIVVWDANTGAGFGHIAIVLSATPTSFVSFDQNWNGRFAHPVTHDYKYVYGYLVPLEEESEDGMELLKYLGVSNETEAKARLKEHLGEHDGKCDWGNDAADRGGYLGSGRRQVKALKTYISKLELDLQACKEAPPAPPVTPTPSLPTDFDPQFWDADGGAVETTIGNQKTIINYKRKG